MDAVKLVNHVKSMCCLLFVLIFELRDSSILNKYLVFSSAESNSNLCLGIGKVGGRKNKLWKISWNSHFPLFGKGRKICLFSSVYCVWNRKAYLSTHPNSKHERQAKDRKKNSCSYFPFSYRILTECRVK